MRSFIATLERSRNERRPSVEVGRRQASNAPSHPPAPAPAISTEPREERKARLLRELEELEDAEAVEELAARDAARIFPEEPRQSLPAEPAARPLTQGEKIRLGKERKARERAEAEAKRK